MSNEFSGQLIGHDAIATYVFGGHARFTVVSKRTGERFTFRVSLPKENDRYGKPDPITGPFFVKLLTGDDNESSYTFIGTVRRSGNGVPYYTHGRNCRISLAAPSIRAFEWFLGQLRQGNEQGLAQCEVWHDGTCCRCGRALTVPESVASGIGPVCAGKA